MSKFYDDKYRTEALYWGRHPSSMARLLFLMFPPQKELTLPDIGCGEGRDSLFFARNGYRVSAFDSSATGIEKSIAWAEEERLPIQFFQADINEYRIQGTTYDVLLASGALHYIEPSLRKEVISNYKQCTNPGGIHAFTIPIDKSFIEMDPEADELERYWLSGEILMPYHDWEIEYFAEEITDDIKSGYKLPVNKLIAREPSA